MMTRLTFTVALGAIVWACAPLGAFAQTSPTPTHISVSDDLNEDGLKLRGDGSIDDDQDGVDDANDDIGDDGLKRRGDGSIDDDQTGDDDRGVEHARGRDRDREDREDDHRGSDHERGRDRDRDRDRDNEHGGNRGHG